MGKILVIIGLLVALVGMLIIFKVPLPFGHLPGDIVIKGENVQVYFPIVTCIVLSILFSVLYYLFFK